MNYGESCSTYLCKTGINFACISGICDCMTAFFWNGLGCATRHTLHEPCANTNECVVNVGLTCQLVFDVPRCECNTATTRSAKAQIYFF